MTNQSFLRNELLDLQVRADELDSDNIRLMKENEKFEIENKKLKSSVNELKDQLCNTIDRKEFDELTSRCDELNEKLENLNKNLKRSKKENETLTNTYEYCLANCNEIEVKYDQCKKENGELKISINELKTISKQTFKDATSKSEEIEEQMKIISILQEENESLKNHLSYLKEQSKKNVSMISCDSFTLDQLANQSILMPESMDIIIETKLKECQKQLEDEQLKSRNELAQLNKKNDELQVNYDQLLETSRLESRKLIELTNENKCILNERGELEKQLKELKQTLINVKDEKNQLIKLHQEEIFKLSESMIKQEQDNRLQLDLQNICKELKVKDAKLSGLQIDFEKLNDLKQALLIKIEQLKANDREKNTFSLHYETDVA